MESKLAFQYDKIEIELKVSDEEEILMWKHMKQFVIRDNILYTYKTTKDKKYSFRGHDEWTHKIGRVINENQYEINNVMYTPVIITTIHPNATSCLFFAYITDVYRALKPEVFNDPNRFMYVNSIPNGSFYKDYHIGETTILLREDDVLINEVTRKRKFQDILDIRNNMLFVREYTNDFKDNIDKEEITAINFNNCLLNKYEILEILNILCGTHIIGIVFDNNQSVKDVWYNISKFCCESLQWVSFSGTELDDECVKQFVSVFERSVNPKLRNLDIQNNSDITKKSIKYLNNLVLNHMFFGFGLLGTSIPVSDARDINSKCIENLEKFKDLDIKGNMLFVHNYTSDFKDNIKNDITSINFSNCLLNKNEILEILDILYVCGTHIIGIVFDNNPSVKDVWYKVSEFCCESLHWVSFSGTDLNDKNIKQFVSNFERYENLNKLRNLDLQDNKDITKKSVKYLKKLMSNQTFFNVDVFNTSVNISDQMVLHKMGNDNQRSSRI